MWDLGAGVEAPGSSIFMIVCFTPSIVLRFKARGCSYGGLNDRALITFIHESLTARICQRDVGDLGRAEWARDVRL